MPDDEPDRIIHADNLNVLPTLPDGRFTLVYLDPPFNTGRSQARQATSHVRVSPTDVAGAAASGTITGFAGKQYLRVRGDLLRYDDRFEDYWGFLEPRLAEAWRVLADDGTLYLHLDYREAHYAKVLLDALFGRECFLNEIVWAYDYGAKAKRRWPTKHDTILVYVKDPARYWFDSTAVDREPYMAPGLVTPEKAELGKLPTDVWWHTIVSPTGREKTGYPTQKPEGILRRIVQASTREGDWVLDFFAGLGHDGGGRRDARAPLRARRRESRGDRDHARAVLGHRGRRVPGRRAPGRARRLSGCRGVRSSAAPRGWSAATWWPVRPRRR